MSLLDALLLEPPVRSIRPIISVRSLTASGAIATAITATNHGFKNGDRVLVSGVAGRFPEQPVPDFSYYNGAFAISNVTPNSFQFTMGGSPQYAAVGNITCQRQWYRAEVWIALRSDRVTGSGTQSDPFDGSSIPYPAINISSLSYAIVSGVPAAIATTSNQHGFSEPLITRLMDIFPSRRLA